MWLHLLGECLGSEQELAQSLQVEALLRAGLVVPYSQPACLYQRAGSFASHLCGASRSICLGVSWSCNPTHATLHPSSLWQHLHRAGASKVDSGGCSVLGGGAWRTKGAPLSEAGALRLPPSGPAGQPVSSVPAGTSRTSRSPTAA